jgi:hypothetical protein
MAMKRTCPQCKSWKRKEVINGGMLQTVHWDGDYVVREETDYEKNLNHSSFYCDNSQCQSYGKEI